jgi:hypothetical protein
MVAIPLVGAVVPITPIAGAIAALYGMGSKINEYLDRHIQDMKGSENPTVCRTGTVLELAKFGFGVGYLTSVVVIATGQYLLGNTLLAISTVATAATMTNPVAMTCAAVGAVYYGWGALSDAERNAILENLRKGLDIGIEFIKAIIAFVIDTTKKLLSSKNFDEMKGYISSAASVFGKTLSDVTHKLSDVVNDTFDVFRKKSNEAIDSTIDLASDAYTTVKETAGKAADGTKETLGKISSKVTKSNKKPPQPS